MADGHIAIAPLAVGAADLMLGSEHRLADDTRISLLPAASRWSLRGRDVDRLATLIGRPLPQRIGETLDGIVRLGPDEWLASLPEGAVLPPAEGLPVSLVDISARSVAIRIEGAGALALLCAGCPLDLAKMRPGHATRTVFETVEILLWCESATCWRVDVWRSFAPWLWNALVAAGG